eukprot:m.137301 g.137301  ORF g.137301 m.137301 type:complete len:177 (+) comp11518_c0_seq1:68-598(+)
MDGFAKGAKKKWQRMLGQEDEVEEQGILGDIRGDVDTCCGKYLKLTYKQRLYGFVYCFALGCIFGILGSALVALGKLTAFAVCYSIGTILSLTSSLFLWGPWHQMKNMFKETRWIATLVMLGSIILTIIAAVVWKSVALCIIFAAIQFLAFGWYCLTYIPYGRAIVKNCATSCCNV